MSDADSCRIVHSHLHLNLQGQQNSEHGRTLSYNYYSCVYSILCLTSKVFNLLLRKTDKDLQNENFETDKYDRGKNIL